MTDKITEAEIDAARKAIEDCGPNDSRLWAILALTAAAKAREEASTQAARDVLAERQRQISAEGWTPEHDDKHEAGQMASAAGCYAINSRGFTKFVVNDLLYDFWPWSSNWWKPTTRRRDLIKAGALILAEIERIDRAGGDQ